jgi:hypothetical protein
MSRWLRYVRIGWSATCAIACVLLVVLWVRSYWWCDSTSAPMLGRSLSAISVKQHIIFSSINAQRLTNLRRLGWNSHWSFNSSKTASDYSGKTQSEVIKQIGLPPFPGFEYRPLIGGGFRAVLPHWFFVLIFLLLGIATWFPWRFSLRTLLIATTLVAITLGIIIATTR